MNIHATKRLTTLSVLTAISFVLTIFPKVALLPGASFLKLDFSIVPIFLALSWYGLGSATLALFVRTLLKVIIFNEGVNTYIGMPVNFAVAWSFLFMYVLVVKSPMVEKWNGLAKEGARLVAAVIYMTVIAVIVNIVWAIPLYAQFAHFDIAKFIGVKPYLFGIVLPFNLIQGFIWYLACQVVVKALAPFKKSYQA
ncbi:ECF transporter S component [Fructobacillus sp. M2-14]|uniref:Riboflavin transporter n=1 Tax=Fructobacillus broussonetiae TaxID=2713173 RepID=A0ABS5QY73_9LACO|nr:ECF transporter S component [Fructobacillus broussonetiae]MBS9338100.1 ECF transporter S component [Fructobacillus broussonetiae]